MYRTVILLRTLDGSQLSTEVAVDLDEGEVLPIGGFLLQKQGSAQRDSRRLCKLVLRGGALEVQGAVEQQVVPTPFATGLPSRIKEGDQIRLGIYSIEVLELTRIEEANAEEDYPKLETISLPGTPTPPRAPPGGTTPHERVVLEGRTLSPSPSPKPISTAPSRPKPGSAVAPTREITLSSVVIPNPDEPRMDFSGYTQTEYFPNGSFKSCVPDIPTEWMILGEHVTLQAEQKICFHPNGIIKSCALAQATNLKAFGTTVLVEPATLIRFFTSGEIQSFTVARQSKREWRYRGKSYAPGTAIRLSEKGDVLGAVNTSWSRKKAV